MAKAVLVEAAGWAEAAAAEDAAVMVEEMEVVTAEMAATRMSLGLGYCTPAVPSTSYWDSTIR